MKHATPAEIVAYRDGELKDEETRRHITACPLCRRVLGDVRWLRTHMRPTRHFGHGPEPTTEEIAAYLDEALNPMEMERVEGHIRSNDRLLAIFDTLLAASMKLEKPLPSRASVEKLKTRLRGPRLLGRLRVHIEDGFQLIFRPARPGEPAFGSVMRAIQAATLKIDKEAAFINAAKIEDPICCEREDEREEMSIEPPPPQPKPSPPKRIDAGCWTISLVTTGTANDARMGLRIVETDTNKPAEKLPLRLEPGRDDPVEALTDENGAAEFPLPDGDSRLEIGDGPELVLEIVANLYES